MTISLFYQEGWTALHFASQDGKVQVAQILIKNGAKVDARGQVSKATYSIIYSLFIITQERQM